VIFQLVELCVWDPVRNFVWLLFVTQAEQDAREAAEAAQLAREVAGR
jgi:hypothetical protein